MTKIESGNIEFESIPFSLRDVIETLVRVEQSHAQTKGLKLDSSFDLLLPSVVLGDPSRIRQVLINFVSNAIKFTESGSVTVALRVMSISEAKAAGLTLLGAPLHGNGGDHHASAAVASVLASPRLSPSNASATDANVPSVGSLSSEPIASSPTPLLHINASSATAAVAMTSGNQVDARESPTTAIKTSDNKLMEIVVNDMQSAMSGGGIKSPRDHECIGQASSQYPHGWVAIEICVRDTVFCHPYLPSLLLTVYLCCIIIGYGHRTKFIATII